MQVRRRMLPSGWYPEGRPETERMIKSLPWEPAGHARACVAPHAGWYFSLSLSAPALQSLDHEASLVVVFGGHLGPGRTPLEYGEDAFCTPLGNVLAATDLRGQARKRFPVLDGSEPDNTVEVLLPLVKYLFPHAKVYALRVPADERSISIGRAVAESAAAQGENAVAIASTDLTHYGSSYGFTPVGDDLERALSWAKDVNDAPFIDAMLRSDGPRVIELANRTACACSAGAVAAALGFCQVQGADQGKTLGYTTSAEEYRGDSFVSYTGLSWSRR